MRYYVLLVLLSAASYAAASCAAAALVRVVWVRRYRRAGERTTAADRARVLATLLFAPATAGAGAALAFAGVFVRFEPRDTVEAIGSLLVAAACLFAVLAVPALCRIVRSLRAGVRCSRLVRTCGRVWNHPDGRTIWLVNTPLPVAAVAGVLRPRLLISTRIIQECSPGEADAIIRHEAAHLRRRDNLVRALIMGLPDPLPWTCAGRALRHAWSAAAEEAADEEAVGADPQRRTDLASALLRVGRMAGGPPQMQMPGVAFYEGLDLEARVRRLLHPVAPTSRRSPRPHALWLLLMLATAGVLSDTFARPLHLVIEAAVEWRP